MPFWLLLFGLIDGFSSSSGSPPEPAPSVDLTFRRTPRLFGPKRVATVDP